MKPVILIFAELNLTPSGKPQPKYDDPKKQALSWEGKYFKYYQIGYFIKDYPINNNAIEKIDGKKTGKD